MAHAVSEPAVENVAYSELAVVATEDNTTVIIKPSPTANLDGHTNAYTNNLMQGETYQIHSRNTASKDYTNDVTGTLISSDKPLGVFAGANAAQVPDKNTAYANPLAQEQLPVESWGTNVVAVSFAGRKNGDSYRILAAYSNTAITITGGVVTITNENYPGPWLVTISNETVTVTNHAGQFFDIIVDGPAWFQANQPIQVAQFANGDNSDNPYPGTGGEGDPCEILLPPTGHYLKTNIVFSPTGFDYNAIAYDFNENFLNIIVAQSATNSTYVDGSLIASTNFMAIANSGYYGAQITLTNTGTHAVICSQPISVEVYGFGIDDAYGYFGGIFK